MSFLRGMRALAIVFISICVIAGTNAHRTRRIVGGSDASPGQFPYQASIRTDGHHRCGGTIISRRHILTAAHCVRGISSPPYADMTVATGSITRTAGTIHHVEDAIVHPNYSKGSGLGIGVASRNDVAVIVLKEEIEENNDQRHIQLANGNPVIGLRGIVTGFGFTKSGQLSNTLQSLEVTIKSGNACLMEGQRVQLTQLCGVRPEGHGTCSGDSGGPLVLNNRVVGIAGGVNPPCGGDTPDVYTNVNSYLSFIKDAMHPENYYRYST